MELTPEYISMLLEKAEEEQRCLAETFAEAASALNEHEIPPFSTITDGIDSFRTSLGGIVDAILTLAQENGIKLAKPRREHPPVAELKGLFDGIETLLAEKQKASEQKEITKSIKLRASH